jgi:anti-sigma regulatory factor (Ser/Thr protein kinase)
MSASSGTRVEQEVPPLRGYADGESTVLPLGGLFAGPPDPVREECPGPGLFAACGLDGRLQNARQARRFVGLTLDRWALQALVPDTEIVVGELVANAVRHALTPSSADAADYPLWLGLFRHPGHLVCAVADPSPHPPRPLDADHSALGGRGLALIDALSESWSWSRTPPHGKTVWATMALPGASPAMRRPVHQRAF